MIWRLIPFRTYNAFENMAMDEAIFRETVRNQKRPTLRFFGWRPAAVSIGYFQDMKNEIDLDRCRLSGVDVVRRITGGKAVYHFDEITYSLSAGRSEKLFPDQISLSYEKISLCLAMGLSFLGINARLAPPSHVIDSGKKPVRPANCFSAPSVNELTVDGKKICGSAQMRTRTGFLQHGSVLISFEPWETSRLILSPQTPDRLGASVTAVSDLVGSSVKAEILAGFLQQGFKDELGVHFEEEPLTQEEEVLSCELRKKYESLSWNQERKAAAPQR
ncbi:MAG TPA: lipoate--protein ligase family protein [Smithellaceae bacterium]|nr:lipoate--protein ligase family protein [Smithellaceae bacterium]